MKRVFKFLAMFVMVASMAFVTSCSKENSIVGKWKFSDVKVEISNVAPEIMEFIDLDALTTMTNQLYKDMIWEFKSNNTVTASGFIDNEAVDNETITYSVSNNKLTFNNPDAEDEDERTIVLDIVTLDAKNLVVSYSEEVEDEEKGMVITETLSFTRM